ncbi:MAG TPA: YihY/virulence factor BrkB family protein [Candidatus Kapabacteria bacterium]|nr:YihY/virulence factor BrkB family protein [Candidatus Kapabacteria bacterium]
MAFGPWELGGLSIAELGKRVYKEMSDDAVFDAAAALAYYFMLAIFPLLIFLISMLASVQALDLVNTVTRTLESAMPGDASKLITTEIQRIMADSGGGLLTFGALGTLWAASSGVVSLLDGLNRAYDVEETRGLLKQRLLAVGLTVALALLIIVGAVALMAGGKVSEWAAEQTGISWVETVGSILHYVIGVAFMFFGLELVYFFGPNVKGQKWKWITPGSALAVVIFVIASFGFTLYLQFGGGYSATYGGLGAVIVLLLWLYLLGLAVMIGGEINAEIAAAALEKGSRTAPKISIEKDAAKKEPNKVSGPPRPGSTKVNPGAA